MSSAVLPLASALGQVLIVVALGHASVSLKLIKETASLGELL